MKSVFNNFFIPNAIRVGGFRHTNHPHAGNISLVLRFPYRIPSPTDQEIFAFIESAQSWPLEATIRNAVQILSEHDLALLELNSLAAIVRSALTPQTLFFAVALDHPGRGERYQSFESFVLSCVTSTQETEDI